MTTRMGICSWKYDSWQGIFYPPGEETLDHLAEYARHFDFLNSHNLYHIFVQGYYMLPINEVYKKYSAYIRDLSVIRLMGSDRHGIEDRAGNKWDTIIDPRDKELPDIVAIIRALEECKVRVYVNVNNHYEGSAPLTIKKIQEMLKEIIK